MIVSNAGALGMMGAGIATPELLEQTIDQLAALTSRPFGVNFLMPFLNRECVPVAARKARVVEFFYDTPDPALVEAAHAEGALVSWQVGSADEAVAAARAGCDLVVAQAASPPRARWPPCSRRVRRPRASGRASSPRPRPPRTPCT